MSDDLPRDCAFVAYLCMECGVLDTPIHMLDTPHAAFDTLRYVLDTPRAVLDTPRDVLGTLHARNSCSGSRASDDLSRDCAFAYLCMECAC